MRFIMTLLFLAVMISAVTAQIPTTPIRDEPSQADAQSMSRAPAALKPLEPEHYTREKVARDMLSASIEALNDQSHASAYRAALSEIREQLVKMRMAALVTVYKQKIIEQAKTALGLQDAQQHDTDTQFRIHLHALNMHGIELDLPHMPDHYHATGLPITPGSLLRSQQAVKP